MKKSIFLISLFIFSCGPATKPLAQRYLNSPEIPEKFKDADEITIEKLIRYSIEEDDKGKLIIKKRVSYDGMIVNPENSDAFYRITYEQGFEQIQMIDVFYVHDGKRINITNIQDIKLNSESFYDNSRAKIFGFRNVTKGTMYHYSYEITYDNLHVTEGIRFVDRFPIIDMFISVNNQSSSDVRFEATGDFSQIQGPKIESIPPKKELSYSYALIDDFSKYEDYSMVRQEIPVFHIFVESAQMITDFKSMGRYFFNLNKENFNISQKSYTKIINEISYSNDDEFIKNLFYYVQDNIRYVALVNGIKAYKADSPETVLKNKYGECKSMSFLLVSILRKKGIRSGTAIVNLGADNYNLALPKLYMANHCVAYAETENGVYWLDATGYYLTANSIIPDLSEKNALVVFDENESIMKQTPSVDYSNNAITYDLDFKMDGKNLFGKGQVSMSSYSAFQFRNILHISHQMDAMEKMKTILLSTFENSIISNLDIKNIKDPTKDLVLTFDLTYQNAVNKFGSRQLINLNPISELRSTKFTGGRHLGEYFYSKPSRVDLKVALEKIEDYSIKSKSEDVNFNQGFIRYSRQFQDSEEAYHFNASFQISKTYFNEFDYQLYSENFLDLKDVFNINIQLMK